MYEGLDRILQHLSNIAESDDPETHGYYCAPQGHVTARSMVKLRDLDQLHDPDYCPSPPPSGADQQEEAAADEDLEGGVVVDYGDEQFEEEQADEERVGILLGDIGFVEGKNVAISTLTLLE